MASAAATPASVFVTLGTQGGPIASAARSQPANVLLRGADAYMIDVGDGAVERLAAASIRLGAVRAVFLSHLHFDHTAGLPALLALRYAVDTPGAITVYGPPGTRQTVDGILAFMEAESNGGYGLPGQVRRPPADTVNVVELVGGSAVHLGDMTVTTTDNTHYSFAPGSHDADIYRSLAFRIDLPDRSIAYTGDTGPSPAVERLARGADLLVSEIIDVAATVAKLRRITPEMRAATLDATIRHLNAHHLTATQLGQMAARAGVKRIVVTHEIPGSNDPADLARYRADIARAYSGPVAIANDMDRF